MMTNTSVYFNLRIERSSQKERMKSPRRAMKRCMNRIQPSEARLDPHLLVLRQTLSKHSWIDCTTFYSQAMNLADLKGPTEIEIGFLLGHVTGMYLTCHLEGHQRQSQR